MSRFSIRNPYFIVVVCLILSVLLYLILIAQFRSFVEPFLIMLAIPMGFVGVFLILLLTGAVFIVPAAYLLVYGRKDRQRIEQQGLRA